MDSSDKNSHSGAGGVFRPQSGERGPAGACSLLLRKHILPSFHQVSQERGQEEGGKRHGPSARGSGKMERSDGKIRKKGWEIAVKHDKIRKMWTEGEI